MYKPASFMITSFYWIRTNGLTRVICSNRTELKTCYQMLRQRKGSRTLGRRSPVEPFSELKLKELREPLHAL